MQDDSPKDMVALAYLLKQIRKAEDYPLDTRLELARDGEISQEKWELNLADFWANRSVARFHSDEEAIWDVLRCRLVSILTGIGNGIRHYKQVITICLRY